MVANIKQSVNNKSNTADGITFKGDVKNKLKVNKTGNLRINVNLKRVCVFTCAAGKQIIIAYAKYVCGLM